MSDPVNESKTPEANLLQDSAATNDPIQELKHMEVHHHGHHEGKKNWKSYFWEFIMLFFAVFCGFLAEYQLEHVIEKDRAFELAKSFYQELKNDSITAELKVQNRMRQEASLSYLAAYFRDSSLTRLPKEFAIHFEYGISFRTPSQFEPRTIVLEQLRNSGSLRYFKNQEFQNLTGDLTVAIKNIYDRQDLETKVRMDNINPIIIKYYDYDFDAMMKKGGKTIFEGIRDYEKSSETVPYHLKEADKIDRQNMVGVLNFYNSNVVNSTRQVHIQKYRDVNAQLLRVLREDFHLN